MKNPAEKGRIEEGLCRMNCAYPLLVYRLSDLLHADLALHHTELVLRAQHEANEQRTLLVCVSLFGYV